MSSTTRDNWLVIAYITTEVKPQGKTAPVEATAEATNIPQSVRETSKRYKGIPFVGEFPFTINDPERNVFIWRACTEM